MAWREILGFVDGSELGLARAQVAHALARAHQAHLSLEVLVTLLQPLYGARAETWAAFFEEDRRAARQHGTDAVRRLQAAIEGDVTVDSQESFPETIGHVAAADARAADLVVLGRPGGLTGDGVDTTIFRTVLMQGGRPCLVLPDWTEPRPWGRRALVAWKGTPESARAVQGALPLLKTAGSVRLWQANPRARREGEDAESIARLATYLRRHDVPLEDPVIRDSGEPAEQLIEAELETFGADLLVMGAYSRPRLQETLFGGMTAHIIPRARIPVLLDH